MTVSNRCIKVTYDIIEGRGETKVPRLFTPCLEQGKEKGREGSFLYLFDRRDEKKNKSGGK